LRIKFDECVLISDIILDLGCTEATAIDQIYALLFGTIHSRWMNIPVELHCPISNPSRQLWYSTDSVYKAAFGCRDESDLSLFLPIFPDDENITFVGSNKTHFATCIFYLVGEFIITDGYLFSTQEHNFDSRFNVEIYTDLGTSITLNTTICKTGVIRNGTCGSKDELGESFPGKQMNRNLPDRYEVSYTVRARDGDRHKCMASIGGEFHSFVVRVKGFTETSEIDRISAKFYRTVYRRWNFRPIELHCPFSNPSRQLWYSTESVYKAAFGCRDGSDLSLFLPIFPDVENITFVGLNSTHFATCTFRLVGEFIEVDGNLFSSREHNFDDRFDVEIYTDLGTSITLNTTICKTGVIRNGSCGSTDALGTKFTGEQINRRRPVGYGVSYTVLARDGDRHQ
uniref:CUB domain-containing protein n=1 Tax=Rodentolepis nana TaxID=102285 RepID=A0A0R3TUU4_RODNA